MNTQDNILTLEAQVIGAILSDSVLFARASFLEKEAFNDDRNGTIWGVMYSLNQGGQRITPATVAMARPDLIDPIGGLAYLNRLSDMGQAITTVFGEAVDRVYDELQWKKIANVGARLQNAALTRDKKPEEILSSLVSIATKNLSHGHAGFKTKKEVAVAALREARLTKTVLTTGIDSLDFLMQGGLQERRMYALGGLYGRGKTIMLGSISDRINIQETPHLFLSLETPPEDIEIRNCATHLKLNASSILDCNDDDHKVFLKDADRYIDILPDYTIYDFIPGATIDEIHRKILAAKSQRGIKGVIIDYWQLIRGRDRGQSEESHLRDVADKLAAICRQENLWIIMTAQIDERGRLKVSESLLQSASLYIRLVREENDRAAYFVTEKSNYTKYADTGSESVPGMVFDDQVGPHFRNTDAVDISDLNAGEAITL